MFTFREEEKHKETEQNENMRFSDVTNYLHGGKSFLRS
jgi:hypothetical protein